MSPSEFTESFRSLCSAFDRNSGKNPEMASQYQNVFHSLSGMQFSDLVQIAIESSDRFPTIAALRKLAFERGFFEKPKEEKQEKRPSVWAVIRCQCGTTFAVRKRDLESDFGSPYGCPGSMGEDCHCSYDAGFLRGRVLDGFADLSKAPVQVEAAL